MENGRVNLTGEIGVSILRLAIQKHIRWIIRDIRETDVGIDATIEQVIEGNPTAKYIAVQLKTGLSNVHINASGDFCYYLDETHYQYWLASTIPVIFVLCDPDSEKLYWAQIAERTIEKTSKQYKLIVSQTSVLNEHSKPFLEDIINTYQGESVIPNSFKEGSPEEKSEYCNQLMENCSESISAIRKEIDRLDDCIKKGIEKAEKFMANNSSGYTINMANKFLTGIAQSYTLGINVCKTRIKNEYPIAIQTHIEAIRIMEECLSKKQLTPELKPVYEYLISSLQDEKEQIESTILISEKVTEHFGHKNIIQNAILNRAERSFAMIVDDYTANLKSLCSIIGNIVHS